MSLASAEREFLTVTKEALADSTASLASEQERGEVMRDLTALAQRDEVTAPGQATVVLPWRERA